MKTVPSPSIGAGSSAPAYKQNDPLKNSMLEDQARQTKQILKMAAQNQQMFSDLEEVTARDLDMRLDFSSRLQAFRTHQAIRPPTTRRPTLEEEQLLGIQHDVEKPSDLNQAPRLG